MKMPDFGSMRDHANRRRRDAWVRAHYPAALAAGQTWAACAREWGIHRESLRNIAARLGLDSLRASYGRGRQDAAEALARAEARLNRRHRREWL